MGWKWHRHLARKLGYDIEKFNQQVVVESHLREQFARLGVEQVIDVGANAGQYAQGLRRVVGFTGEIHSFEPVPEAFETLSSQAHADANWHVHNIALSDRQGEADFYVSARSEFSSLHASNEAGRDKFAGALSVTRTMKVPVRRLDEYDSAAGLDITTKRTFLKMDTQGHDAWVFRGASALHPHIVGLQSEVSVLGIYADVPDYIELLTLYREAGFELTGSYAIHRHKASGHLLEMDCVLARR